MAHACVYLVVRTLLAFVGSVVGEEEGDGVGAAEGLAVVG